ncbi:Kri1-like C-terminal, partial [Arabidopsis thaliana x Arabidopsis arenosa]
IMGRPKAIPDDDDGDDLSQFTGFELDEKYMKRLEHNKNREALQRHEEQKKKGLIDDPEEDSEPESEPNSDLGNPESDLKFVDLLLKVKKKDPIIKNKDAKFFESDESSEEDEVDEKDKKKKKKKKKKKLYLKDVQANHLLEEGPEFVEEDEERKVRTYAEQQGELRRAVTDALEAGGNESDGDDDFLRVVEKEGDDDVEVDQELAKKIDEYFGEEAEVVENQFLKDYLVKQLWKEKEEKIIDKAELKELSEDEQAVWDQEDFEAGRPLERSYRHEENAGDIVMGQSRVVEGSVRKKDNARKVQRKSKEERMKMAEIERKEELKRLKNVKKKEMKEKMKKVLSVAGFKDGEECPLDAKDFDDEFDPEEYDKMMKAAFDDKYYGAEDSDLNSDEDDDGEKPDFDKEDELLGLPKDWDVTKGGDVFTAAREKGLKHKGNVLGNDGEEEEEEVDDEEEEEEQEEVDEEKEAEGKRKRKRKTSLVQRAKEALMEEYYKLDYEDTIGDLKTRFKYAKVQPNRFELDTGEILTLDDADLNQYVPLKKMAPYVEKDWEVNKHKVKEQKLKIRELWEGKHNEKKSKKRKKTDVAETKPTPKADEEGEAEAEAKLSRKAKRRRRQAEKKLPASRMAAYGKA